MSPPPALSSSRSRPSMLADDGRNLWIGREARELFVFHGGRALILRPGRAGRPGAIVKRLNGHPFDLLEKWLEARGGGKESPTIRGGPWAVGYLGYDLQVYLEPVPPPKPSPVRIPDAAFLLFDELETVPSHLGADLGADLGGRCRSPGLHGRVLECDQHAWPGRMARLSNMDMDTYFRCVEKILGLIAAGDIYQANFAQRFSIDYGGNPAELFQSIRRSSPAPYNAFLDFGAFQIVSNSPECFLRIDGDKVSTEPIKGTRPRGRTLAEDRFMAKTLAESSKDRAEHVMIVDLERNDLGRVCEPGSVAVAKQAELRSFANVHHLVSVVEGRLRPGLNPVDVLRAAFPGGSVTGAPKVRAMQIIHALEPERRGAYTGAIGRFRGLGSAELSIGIRTAVISRGRLSLHAGGGIVSDSSPEAEYRETLDKASLFLALAQESLRMPKPPAGARDADIR